MYSERYEIIAGSCRFRAAKPAGTATAGKNASYVAGRLKLTELIPDVADAFLADRLTIGEALLIAKLPPAQKYEAFQAPRPSKPTWMTTGQTGEGLSVPQ